MTTRTITLIALFVTLAIGGPLMLMQMHDATTGQIAMMGIQLIAAAALFAGAIALYFLPAIVGRKKRNAEAIQILNLFLGWTLVGWVVALVWAYTKDPESIT